MSIDSSREADPPEGAEDAGPRPSGLPGRYPLTTGYVAVMVTLILLAVLFDWRL